MIEYTLYCEVVEELRNIMRIAVCDDDQHVQRVLKDAIYRYSNMHHFEIAVDNFLSGEDLLNSMKSYDVILLDYRMDGINGLETAKILRRRNHNSMIIFITGYPSFVYESFEVSTYRFLEKPVDLAKLYKAFDDFYKQFGNDYVIVIRADRANICIKTSNIVYLEADNKCCYVNLFENKYHCSQTMVSIHRLLPQHAFFRVSKSFVVNLGCVEKFAANSLSLSNGGQVYTSRKYSSLFRSRYMEFVKNRIGRT